MRKGRKRSTAFGERLPAAGAPGGPLPCGGRPRGGTAPRGPGGGGGGAGGPAGRGTGAGGVAVAAREEDDREQRDDRDAGGPERSGPGKPVHARRHPRDRKSRQLARLVMRDVEAGRVDDGR